MVDSRWMAHDKAASLLLRQRDVGGSHELIDRWLARYVGAISHPIELALLLNTHKPQGRLPSVRRAR